MAGALCSEKSGEIDGAAYMLERTDEETKERFTTGAAAWADRQRPQF
jgi:hypothetical protein